MKTLNIIISTLLAILSVIIVYLIIEYDGVVIDPMGDGQSGIGKAVLALMIVGIGLVPLLFVLIYITLLIVRPKNGTRWTYINLILSMLVPCATLLYLFF